MGGYDGAETCELVGNSLLSQLKDLNINVGLYRDDGLAITNATPRDTENIKRKICRIFNNNGLRITIEANKQIIDFLDVTFNLNRSTYQPFTKPNTSLQYVHRESNHPPTTTKNIPAGQDHDGQVTLSSGVQQWTVPYTGDYRIKAIAAAGGYDGRPNSIQYRGRGARMIATFRLNKSEVIQILVGQEGGINTVERSSGGGGGTFVVRGANKPLIIAGGGGGVNAAESRHKGCDASIDTTGNRGYKSWSGGSNGHGAQTADDHSGGGGGGFYSSGRSGKNFNGTIGYGGEGGKGFIQGGVGGRAILHDIDGGFGGGGGGFGWGGGGGGGGGGGYSGGSSGNKGDDTCGGGGGSYNIGNNQDNECCYNNVGHGQVTITFLD
ncbi:loricrin-like [Stylophora pistillata]|uniref:loricrin-like n=1 Tax=Stylophora pistillata TaxID=50429 RepID=UPI000C04956A|nr:loricrin-like [Stylophora pistillata]